MARGPAVTSAERVRLMNASGASGAALSAPSLGSDSTSGELISEALRPASARGLASAAPWRLRQMSKSGDGGAAPNASSLRSAN